MKSFSGAPWRRRGAAAILAGVTIRGKLTAGFSAVVSATLLGTYLILAVSEFLHLKAEQDREHRAALDKLSSVAAEAALNRNDVILLNYLQSLRATPGLAYAAFVDPQGSVHAHTEVTRIGERWPEAAPESRVRGIRIDARGRRLLEWEQPVRAASRRLGTARLSFLAEELDAQVRAVLGRALLRFTAVVAAALALGFVGAALLARGFDRPIAALVEGAVRLGDGRLDTRLETGRDDELGRLALEFNRMAAKLQEVDELKDRFLHSVSHEIRSPLTAIQAYATVLSSDQASNPSPLLLKGLGIIKEETERLAGFLNDILDLAKLEARRMEFQMSPVDAAELAREVAELFKPKAQESGIELACAAPAPAWTSADREALRRALVNLASNALKFTPQGGTIRISAEAKDGAVRLEVKDSGIGIPEERQGQLFSRFSQVREAKDVVRKAAGTGLGLAISKEIVDAHGGTIGVSSRHLEGAAFHITLKARAAPVAAGANPAG